MGRMLTCSNSAMTQVLQLKRSGPGWLRPGQLRLRRLVSSVEADRVSHSNRDTYLQLAVTAQPD